MILYKPAFRYKVSLCILAIFALFVSSSSSAQFSYEDKEPLEFHPSFSVSGIYRDNINQGWADGKLKAHGVQWRPALDLKYNGDWHTHELKYSSDFIRYDDLPQEDTNTHHVDLRDFFSIGKIIEFTVHTVEDFRSEQRDLRLEDNRSNYLDTNNLTVNPSLKINFIKHTSLVGYYTFSRTSIMEDNQEDYLSNSFGGTLNRELPAGVELFAGYRYREQEFLRDTPDFIDRVILGGVNWDITSSLRLESEYGFSSREYEEETLLVPDSETENDTWKVTLINDATEDTHIDISYSQDQAVREITATEQVLVQDVSINITHVIEYLATINLTGSYREEDFEFSDRHDTTSEAHLSLTANFTKTLSIKVGGGAGYNKFWSDSFWLPQHPTPFITEQVYTYQAEIIMRPLKWLTGSFSFWYRENDLSRWNPQLRGEFDQSTFTTTFTAFF